MSVDPDNEIGVALVATSGALILRLSGEFDLATTTGMAYTRLRSAVAELPPPSLVVVDLTEVDFFSAAGVRLLRQFVDMCTAQGLSVRIVATPDHAIRRVIAITGLDEQVPTFDELDLALNAG